MASGEDHDKSILLTTPFIGGVMWGTTWDIGLSVLISSAYLIGGGLLSPDLDLKQSRPYQRWGILKWLWYPYQLAIPHRHPLSHGVFIGSLGRVAYLFAIIFLILELASYLTNTPLKQMAIGYLNANWETLTFLFVGIEASAWNHLILDGIMLKLGNILKQDIHRVLLGNPKTFKSYPRRKKIVQQTQKPFNTIPPLNTHDFYSGKKK